MHMPEHAFWWLLAMACIVWYSCVTVYVAIRGAADIRTMLRHLASFNAPDDDAPRASKHDPPTT